MGTPAGQDRRPGRAFASPEATTFRRLVQVAELLQGDLDGLLSAHDLTASQFDALQALLAAGEEGLSGSELARSMLSRAPDTTRLLDRLEAQGLAERLRSAADRRVVFGRLTDHGRSVLAALEEPVRRLHREQLGHLGAEPLKALRQLLERVSAGGLVDEGDVPGSA